METKQKRHIPFKIITFLLLISWMYLIFLLSNQTATESSAVSGGLITSVANFLMPNASPEKIASIVSACQFFVRKGAHFTLYAVLGLLSYLTVITYRFSLAVKVFLSLTIGLAYAISDEYHQTYIEGRSGELRDIFIDFTGVLLAVLIALFITLIVKNRKKKKEGKKMKKKDYILLTDTLQKELHKSRIAVSELEEENADLLKECSDLNDEISALRKQLYEFENTHSAIEESEIDSDSSIQGEGPDPMTVASQIIGKLVLNTAKYCNSINTLFPPEKATELINPILGRTEVAKSEIFKILSSENDSNSKISAIESEYNVTEAYFKSVMAQK